MEYRRYGDFIAVRLDKNDEITECVMNVAKAEKISAGTVSGIGATDNFTVGVFNTESKEYEKYFFDTNHEITNLSGNISTMNNEEYVHLHITCAGKNASIVGGHLLKGVISLTGEIVITVSDGKIDRKRDETIGINKWNF